MPHVREYFDRDLPDPDSTPMRPARATQQETYSYLRSCLMQAIGEELPYIRMASAKVSIAADQLDRFKRANPSVEFRVFRPEDLQATDDASSKLFLR